MKPFNLEDYLKNPSRKVVTRNGRKVRIICTNRRSETYPIVSLIETEYGEETCWHAKNGKYVRGQESNNDLFFAPEKHEGWVNLYMGLDDKPQCGIIYDSEVEAKSNGSDALATIKIEWLEE